MIFLEKSFFLKVMESKDNQTITDIFNYYFIKHYQNGFSDLSGLKSRVEEPSRC